MQVARCHCQQHNERVVGVSGRRGDEGVPRGVEGVGGEEGEGGGGDGVRGWGGGERGRNTELKKDGEYWGGKGGGNSVRREGVCEGRATARASGK